MNNPGQLRKPRRLRTLRPILEIFTIAIWGKPYTRTPGKSPIGPEILDRQIRLNCELRRLTLTDRTKEELLVFSHASQAFNVAVEVVVAGGVEEQLDVGFLARLE